MSRERGKPTPKEATRKKKRKERSQPQEKISVPSLRKILSKNFSQWGFETPGPDSVIRWRKEPTVLYLGEIKHNEDLALNLIVLEQLRLDRHMRLSVHWWYASYHDFPLKRALRETKREEMREWQMIQALRRCEPVGIARLEERMLKDVQRFRGY